MHNFTSLGRGQKIILGLGFLVFILAGLWILSNINNKGGQITTPAPSEELNYTIDERPVDFVKVGTITANNPGLVQDTLYFIYEEPGKPALKKELVIDTLSVCGALPCILMSLSLDVAFGGKRVVIEAIKHGEDTVILRKMTVVVEGQEPRLNESGSIFVPWMYVRSLIKECKVSSVMQTHALDVYVTMKENNRRVRTVEPVIDEIFRALDEVRSICPAISVATE